MANAEDALKLLATEHFDVLLTDYQLPGMDGLALARKARLEHPALAIIFSSGYGDIESAALQLGAKMLKKPFDLEALKAALK